MKSTALILGLLATSSAFAGNFAIQSAYPSDAAGNAVQPKLGEAFWMTVRYETDQAVYGSMAVSTPWSNLTSPTFQSQAGFRQATYGPLISLYDGPMPVQVQIGDAFVDTTVTPTSPVGAIEYFDAMAWNATFGAALQFKFGATSKIEWLIPRPPTFGFQTVFATRLYQGQNVANDVMRLLNVNQTETSFQAETSSVRVNASLLSRVKFDSLKKVSSDLKPYLKSETYIESGDKNVKALVSSTLPKNFQKTMSVYDAAQALYQRVVQRLQYVRDVESRPSAAQALKTGYGDCGYFASAFSAACRNAGIPARPVTGFLKGNDEWHVWAEFFVPGHGWVPVDPSFADGEDPQGNYPLYFGVIPELNQRVATAVGFDHSFSKYKVPMLQSPYAITDVKKVLTAWSWSQLTERQ